jgi:Family of unknown function (DUF6174)
MKTRLVGAVLVALTLFGCGGMGEDPNQRALLQLSVSRQTWSAQAIHAYSFDYDHTAMIFFPRLHIEVLADTVNRATDRDTGAVYANAGVPTVDSLFARVQELITSPHSDLSVQYNLALGYPTRIVVDSTIPDAGSTIAVTNFQRAP